MPIILRGSIEGDVQLNRKLGLMISGVKDFSTPLENSADRLLNTADRNFDARGGLMGGWRPRARVYDHPILEDTGEMRGSFFKAVTYTMAIIGNTDRKFPYHQSNKPRRKIPRRVMLKIIESDKRAIVKEFQSYVQSLLRARS